MTPEQFCYWLQGFLELSGVDGGVELTAPRVQMISDHLQLMFEKRTTPRPSADLAKIIPARPSDPKRIC